MKDKRRIEQEIEDCEKREKMYLELAQKERIRRDNLLKKKYKVLNIPLVTFHG